MIANTELGAFSVQNESNPEDTWDSKKWLQKNGLKAQRLSFYDVLADCSFRHADGVVDIKTKPENESVQTSAVSEAPSVGVAFSAPCGKASLWLEPSRTTVKGSMAGIWGFPHRSVPSASHRALL